ncbi:MAG TPA: ATP synthase subunit I [Methylophilaceae bacterium]|nr:ATP synthase subunit I [Methylophilaceae bacterium]
MENIKTADVFKQMAKWQLIATSAVAVGAFFLAGMHGALSALAGGGSAIAGAYAGSLIARRSENKKDAGAILIGLLKAEGVKILVIAALLFITFKVYTAHLVPLALIIGLGASAILSGAAISGLNEKVSEKSS